MASSDGASGEPGSLAAASGTIIGAGASELQVNVTAGLILVGLGALLVVILAIFRYKQKQLVRH